MTHFDEDAICSHLLRTGVATDLGERAAGTDPRDPSSTIPEGDFFVVLPYNGERVPRTLRFGTTIEQADVYFLVDMTGSMRGERTNLVTGLLDVIIPGIHLAFFSGAHTPEDVDQVFEAFRASFLALREDGVV